MTLSRRHEDTPRGYRRPAIGHGRGGPQSALPLLDALDRLLHRASSVLSRTLRTLDPAGRGWRHAAARRFRPMFDGGLEVRVVMSHAPAKVLGESAYFLRHPNIKRAFESNLPPQVHNAPTERYKSGQITRRRSVIATQTADGGMAVEVTALDGSHYMIKLSYTSNTISTDVAEGANGQEGNSSSAAADALVQAQNGTYPQPIGTVRAYAMPGGRVGIIVDGSTQNTDLTINPLGQVQYKGYAESFGYGNATRNHLLNIGQLTVNSGQIGDIEGFQTAELSGPLVSTGTTPIDRIALDAILPGASITTGGDVNTLDVYNNIDLSGAGSDISIGRDLNLLNVGTGITLSNGANFIINRNLGLISQAPKGTGTGSNVLSLNYTNVSNSITTVTIPSVGTFIEGSVNIGPGSTFGIVGQIYNTMYVEGSVNGYSRLFENYGSPTQANPPYITSLAFTATTSSGTTTTTIPPSTNAGPPPDGYLTALQGITP